MGAKSGNDSRFFDNSRRTTSLCIIHEDGLDKCNSAIESDGENRGNEEHIRPTDVHFAPVQHSSTAKPKATVHPYPMCHSRLVQDRELCLPKQSP